MYIDEKAHQWGVKPMPRRDNGLIANPAFEGAATGLSAASPTLTSVDIDEGTVDGVVATDCVFVGSVERASAVIPIATAGAVTLTTAQTAPGVHIQRDPAGGARTDTTPAASALVSAFDLQAGDNYELTVENTADAAETITLAGGAGVDDVGTLTVDQDETHRFRITCLDAASGSEACALKRC